MQKSELVNEVALRTGTKKQIVNAVVNTWHELIVDTLSTGEDVVITGFGRYAVSKRPARPGRHPQTGESLWISAHVAARLVPSKVVTKRLNKKSKEE